MSTPFPSVSFSSIPPGMLTALLHLASPALPVGAYSYSQGLETAVEEGIVHDAASAETWIAACLAHVVARYEAPVWLHLRQACSRGEWQEFLQWNDEFVATRETAELRAETLQMGYSLIDLLSRLGHAVPFRAASPDDEIAFPAAHAWACECWNIEAQAGLAAYLFSWAENQVMAALKAVPLGQLAGQKMLMALREIIEQVVQAAIRVAAHDAHDSRELLSTQAPAFAIVSARHENQYSRLYRS